MKVHRLLVLVCLSGLSGITRAQFIVKNTYFETTGLSNDGQVAGYVDWSGPYMIWTPESQQVDTIWGVAPGNGVGGKATFSNDGTVLSGTANGANGTEMATYSVVSDTWTTHGGLGLSVDNNKSNGYAISGDGNYLVGNSWADSSGGVTLHTHAVVWSQAAGLLDLGTLYAGKSTRANAVSNDGSVIIGWQDINGPWKAARWKRNTSGAYLPNTFLLIDPQGSATDEYNQLGEATAVSGDGNWIGGAGDYATDGNPWLWNETSGYVDLGTLSAGASGYVSGVNHDGTVAVGRFQIGPWDPELPFIWTAAAGLQNLNDYATNVLGLTLGTMQIYSATNLSDNGFYIAGYGVDNSNMAFFTYRLSLEGALGIDEVKKQEITVYPNPVKEVLKVTGVDVASCKITSLSGDLISTAEEVSELELSELSAGMYLLEITTREGAVKTQRFVKQ